MWRPIPRTVGSIECSCMPKDRTIHQSSILLEGIGVLNRERCTFIDRVDDFELELVGVVHPEVSSIVGDERED